MVIKGGSEKQVMVIKDPGSFSPSALPSLACGFLSQGQTTRGWRLSHHICTPGRQQEGGERSKKKSPPKSILLFRSLFGNLTQWPLFPFYRDSCLQGSLGNVEKYRLWAAHIACSSEVRFLFRSEKGTLQASWAPHCLCPRAIPCLLPQYWRIKSDDTCKAFKRHLSFEASFGKVGHF